MTHDRRVCLAVLAVQVALFGLWYWQAPRLIAEQIAIMEAEQSAGVRAFGIEQDRRERRDQAQDEFNKTVIQLLEKLSKEK